MRGLGIVALVIGVICVVSALGMDVSVSTGVGGGRVNNLGLMADRQNYTLVGGMVALAGLLLLMFGGTRGHATSGTQTSFEARDTRPCPLCAEPIKLAAVKCKHCGADVQAIQREVLSNGWTVRIPSKPGPEFDRVRAILEGSGHPLLPPDGCTSIVGYFADREEAKLAQKKLSYSFALQGDLYLPQAR